MVETVLCRTGGSSPYGYPERWTGGFFVPSYYTVKEKPTGMDTVMEETVSEVRKMADSPYCRFSRWANENKALVVILLAATAILLGGGRKRG